ncbi:MAG: hypothetical protein M8860_05545 [marine benthic group bacterium]|nr:hypothetical protein [Candidatus Carthagonibacter metallireducens]MCL7974817.1 hypothetical protein [Gemmatimonadota bacterium]
MYRFRLSSAPVRLRDVAMGLILALAITGCESQTAPLANSSLDADQVVSSITSENAAFPVWHQGFNSDTDGWFDADTPDALGWCGSIDQHDRQTGSHAPSKGRGYATVAIGACNAFWSALGVPFGAPYGAGPGQSLYSDSWPVAGYITELDIFLDPTWSGSYTGNFLSPNTIVQYAATIFSTTPEEGPFHTGPHYFVPVDAVPGQEALSIFGHRVTKPGWYTFRFSFSDEGGSVRVDFTLAERRGGDLITRTALPPIRLAGPVQIPFVDPLPTSGYGSGHVWFFDVAAGLQLPIDEHRVRLGR